MHRFIGEWCKRMDENGDHEYAHIVATSEDEAHRLAIENGKKAGEGEWVGVREQVWVGDKRLGHWETISRKTGDWDGYLE